MEPSQPCHCNLLNRSYNLKPSPKHPQHVQYLEARRLTDLASSVTSERALLGILQAVTLTISLSPPILKICALRPKFRPFWEQGLQRTYP